MMYPISKINVLFWHIVLWIADWITFHKFGITGQYLSQYICLLDNTREHLRDPIFYFLFPPPPPDQPLRPMIVQSQTINILRTTSKIQATPLLTLCPIAFWDLNHKTMWPSDYFNIICTNTTNLLQSTGSDNQDIGIFIFDWRPFWKMAETRSRSQLFYW